MRGKMLTDRDVRNVRRYVNSSDSVAGDKKRARRKARRLDKIAIRLGDYEHQTRGLSSWDVI